MSWAPRRTRANALRTRHREVYPNSAQGAATFINDWIEADRPGSSVIEESESRNRFESHRRFAMQNAAERPFEQRDLHISASTGQEIVPPLFLTDLFVASRQQREVVAKVATTQLPLPEAGRTVHLPYATGNTGVGIQTEASPLTALTEVDATTAERSAEIIEIGGFNTLSLFLFDRSQPQAGQIIAKNLADSIYAKIDNQLVNGDGTGELEGLRTNAGESIVVPGQTVAQTHAALADALQRVVTNSGGTVSMRDCVILMHERRWRTLISESAAQQADAIWTAHDLLRPSKMPTIWIENGPDGSVGFLPRLGGPRVFLTSSIPTTVSTSQDVMIVTHAGATFHHRGPIKLELVFGGDVFKTSGVHIGARMYASAIAAYPDEIVEVTGFTAPTFSG